MLSEEMMKKYMAKTVPSEQVNLLDGTTKRYLPLADQISLFREMHPEGKVTVHALKMEANSCVIEARVYLDKNDNESSFVANAIVSRYANMETDMFARAVASARSSALSAAGFGCQFASTEDLDPKEEEKRVPFAGIPVMVETEVPEKSTEKKETDSPPPAMEEETPVTSSAIPEEICAALQTVWPYGANKGMTFQQLSEIGKLKPCIDWFLSQESRWAKAPELLDACRNLEEYVKSKLAIA